jgi:hypothetical protein
VTALAGRVTWPSWVWFHQLAWHSGCFVVFFFFIPSFSFFSSFLPSLVFSIHLDSTERYAWTYTIISPLQGGRLWWSDIGYILLYIPAFNSCLDVRTRTRTGKKRIMIHSNEVGRSMFWGSLKSRRLPEVCQARFYQQYYFPPIILLRLYLPS